MCSLLLWAKPGYPTTSVNISWLGPLHLLAEVPFGESGCYEAFIRSWLYVIIRKSKQSTFVFLGLRQHSINATRETLMKYSLKDFCTWWHILLHCTTEIWSTQHLACLLWLKQTLFLLLCYYDSPQQLWIPPCHPRKTLVFFQMDCGTVRLKCGSYRPETSKHTKTKRERQSKIDGDHIIKP